MFKTFKSLIIIMLITIVLMQITNAHLGKADAAETIVSDVSSHFNIFIYQAPVVGGQVLIARNGNTVMLRMMFSLSSSGFNLNLFGLSSNNYNTANIKFGNGSSIDSNPLYMNGSELVADFVIPSSYIGQQITAAGDLNEGDILYLFADNTVFCRISKKGFDALYVDSQWWNTPPTITISLPSANQSFSAVSGYNSMSISGNVTDPDVGDKNYIQYNIDSGATQTLALSTGKSGADGTGDYVSATGSAINYAGSVDVTGLAEGTHNVTIWAIDNNGGTSSQTTVQILMDKTAPTAPSFTFTAPSGYTSGSWTTTKPVKFTITSGTDSGSGVLKSQYRLNGGAWTDYSSEVSVSTSGTTTVDAQTLDKVGHISTLATVTIKINNPPTITVNTPTVNQAFSEVTGYSQINVTGTVTDADNDNCTVTATLDGVIKTMTVNSCGGGKPFSLTLDVNSDHLPEGTPVISVVADDGK